MRGLRQPDPAKAVWAALAILIVLDEARARAEEDEAAPQPPPRPGAIALLPSLTPPLHLAPLPRAPRASITPRELRLSVDLGMSYVRFAVHGDYKPGLAPFLGTSTAALGGFRLRF
jgi:hypothetical protein